MKKTVLTFSLLLHFSYASEILAMEKACERKVAEACHQLALLAQDGLGVKKDLTKAKAFYLKACNYGYDKACHNFEHIDTKD